MKEYRIDICETIRLGTFYNFRMHEKNEIKDENEGITDGLHIAPNKTIHPNTPEQIEQFNSVQKFFKIQYTNPNIIPNNSIRSIKNIGKTSLTNCFLFSCSEPPSNIGLMKKLECDSYYEITDIKKFSDLLTKSLGERLGEIRMYENCILRANWKKVEYSDSENMPVPLKIKHSDYAKKKTKFVSEHEHRLIIILAKTNNQIISVENKPINLKVTNELKRCCKWNKE